MCLGRGGVEGKVGVGHPALKLISSPEMSNALQVYCYNNKVVTSNASI